MIKYDESYNPIREYWDKIRTGKIKVCKKIYRQYEHLNKKLLGEIEPEYVYSPKRANHVLEFFENFCTPSKGKSGNKPLKLMLWEKAMLAAAFGFVDKDGLRQCQELVLIVAKKNGKSAIASGVGLYLLIGDGENGPEVYAVSTKKDQSKIIWDEAKRMTNKSVYLKKMVRAYVSNIHCALNDGDFKPLGSDVDTLDGLNIHGALMDEIHQWKHGQALYDIIADGITARDQPFICLTSTSGTIREDFYDSKYDDCSNTISGYDLEDGVKNERLFPFIYELDKRDEWKDPDAWVKANPGLGEIKQLSKLEHKVEQAKIHPEQIKNLLTKEFNIPETSSETWLTMEELVNKETFDIDKLHPRYGIGGVDLASTTDLTCATIIFRVEETEELYVCQMYWMPADLIEKRIEEDRIPYDKWIEKGWMRPSGSDCVDYRDIAKWFQEMQDEHDIYLYAAGYDPWNMNCLIADLKLTFGEGTFREVKQLKKVMSVPMQIMKTQLAGKKINYNNNPILLWCLSNAAIDIDKNNNIQLCKKGSRTKRIDGAASLVDAFVIYQNDFENYMKMIRR